MDDVLSLCLSDGADIKEGLERLAKKEGIGYGLLVSVDGWVKEFELLSRSQGALEKTRSEDEAPLKAISGKIQRKAEGQYDIQIKASLAKSGLATVNGSLLKGKASGKLVIGVRKLALNKIIEA